MSSTTTIQVPDTVSEDVQSRILARARVSPNKALSKSIVKAFDDNPPADFEQVLEKTLLSYRTRLANAYNTAEARRQAATNPIHRAPSPEKPRFCHPPGAVLNITWPLDTALADFLDLTDAARCSGDTSKFFRRINEGDLLFSLHSRSVVRLSEHIVVKMGHTLGLEESAALSYLARFDAFPAPRPLGQVVIGKTSYTYLTFVPGNTLEKVWPKLSQPHKESICSQLNVIMSELRHLPPDPDTPLGTLSLPHVCKDYQINVYASPPDIHSVSEFHDWNISLLRPTITPGYRRWLRSRFRDEYSIVLTHGDFHPRNIMVLEQPDGSIELSGIIDWEMCGWYPEYWEMYKALNTRDARDESDWWDMLPECVSGYDCEVVAHLVREQGKHS